jgi:nickel transport protein
MRFKHLLPLFILPFIGWSTKALAHGTEIDYQNVQAIQIDAKYAGGQPMGNAQVTIYSPDNPSTPWKKGTTDEQGQFSFVPDPSKPGNWEVKVRQAGHGNIISIPVNQETVTSPTNAEASGSKEVTESSNGLNLLQVSQNKTEDTLLQKALLAGAGAWGFFGTALFFARGKKTA